MCGIAGIFRFEGPTTRDDVAAVRMMSRVQRHRGPDDHGCFQDSRVALGHRRLSIIDVSTCGRQPMSNEDASVWVVYNGEIYNHPELRDELSGFGHEFRSRSDTEVLVHGYEQWGAEGLFGRLRGMFGIALYDSKRESLFLARDRSGIKPIYYLESPGSQCLAFASETRALCGAHLDTGGWDIDALAGFLLFGSVPSPRTSFRNVRSVISGHYLSVARDGSVMRRYRTSPCSLQGVWPDREEQPAPVLRRRLVEAVKRHLISDVPVGLFLSGGMDSVGLLSLIARARTAPLTTLTVAFEDKRLSEVSEGVDACKIARSLGADHREVLLGNKDFISGLPRFLAAMDQPTIDGLNTYFISKAARSAGLAVVLSGLGGDEVFWGYRHYQWFRACGVARLLNRLPAVARGGLLKSLAAYGRITGQERWLRLSVLRDGVSSKDLYFVARGLFSPDQVSRLLGIEGSRVKRVLDECCEKELGRENTLDPATFNLVEIKRYLHDQLLRDTDVYSMAHSIEVRVPYLDQEVVSLATRSEASRKLRHGINKPLLAELIDDPLVWDAARRRKRGFSLPLEEWIHNSLDQILEMPTNAEFLEKQQVRRILDSFRAGRSHWSRAWSLVVLGAHAATNS